MVAHLFAFLARRRPVRCNGGHRSVELCRRIVLPPARLRDCLKAADNLIEQRAPGR